MNCAHFKPWVFMDSELFINEFLKSFYSCSMLITVSQKSSKNEKKDKRSASCCVETIRMIMQAINYDDFSDTRILTII